MHPRSAFTLIELLVVIAILAVLAVVVVLTLNPAGLLQESRDNTRLSDTATLNTAISLFSADVTTGNGLGQSNVLYLSVPDPIATSTAGDQCQGLGLASSSLPSGWSYQCASPASYRKSDGTGWIPINFTQASFGTPLSQLPVDPTNTTSTGLYYTYVTNGTQYEVTSLFESSKYKSQYAANLLDPDYPEVNAKGSNLSLNPLWNPNGLVGWWPVNEGSGSTTVDQSGNGNNGTWNGSMTGSSGYYSAGKVGAWAGAFDGNSAYVGITATTSLNILTNVTVAEWINLNSATTSDSIDRGCGGYTIWFSPPNIIWAKQCTGASQISGGSLALGTWYDIVGTYDGTTFKIYVNGVLKGQTVYSTTFTSAANLTIGKGGDGFTSGLIDDLRIYNRTFSPAEVQALYNAEK